LAGGRKATRFWILAGLAVLALTALGLDLALAQGNPFGGPRPPAAPPPDGIIGWLLLKQAQFYQKLATTIRAAKTDGSAAWLLMGISFAYGIFHAAGPGHGKAVISSYLVANEETWKRGVTLSFASALVQAMVAIAVVGIAAVLLNATAKTMNNAVWWIEIVSYLLIALMGARLLWTKGRAFIGEWQLLRAPKTLGAAATVAHALERGHHHHGHHHDHDHGHDDHAHHDHAHDNHHDHAHDHGNPAHGEPGHVHDEHCGHSHGPTPDQLAGPGGWKRGLVAIFAVGLRPCSGAILVLVFALAQGIFWAGVAATVVMGLGTAITVAAIATLTVSATAVAARIAATRTGYGSLALRAVEVGAAAVVLLFGIALLAGYMVTERLVGI
jgi:nickel/cobalt exporter